MASFESSIYDWNPWLEQGSVPTELVGFPREITPKVISSLSMPHIKIFYGIRRAGKSTLMYQVIDHLIKNKEALPREILLINFEDLSFQKESLEGLVSWFRRKFNPKKLFLFLDEVQSITGWEHYVRSSYDRKEKTAFFLSGSSASLLRREYATLFTGRNLSFEVFPLSFKEFLSVKKVNKKDPATLLHFFDEYATYGGFPEVVLTEEHSKKKELLNHYFQDILYKDIVARFNVSAEKLKNLAVFLLTNISSKISLRKLHSTLGISLETLDSYLSFLKEAMLIQEVRAFSYSYKEQLVRPKKVYCVDPGLRNVVGFSFSEDKGKILENVVFNGLLRTGNDIFYWQGNKECDFIVADKGKPFLAVQVCTDIKQKRTREREEQGLLEAMDSLGLSQGLIITEDFEDELEMDGKTLKYLPAWKWLLDPKESMMLP